MGKILEKSSPLRFSEDFIQQHIFYDLQFQYASWLWSVHAYTVKPLNNGLPEERPLVNNDQILIVLAYFNTFATLKSGHY